MQSSLYKHLFPSFYNRNSFFSCYFLRIQAFKPRGNLLSAPSSRTGGWEKNQKASTRLENYLGLNYYFPFETVS